MSIPPCANVQYELDSTLRQSGDLAGAIAGFERALAIDPELREGYYGLGTALKQQAAALRKPGAPPTPSAGDDLFKQAQTAAASGDLGTAKLRLIEALRLDDRHAEAHNLLGFILGQTGDLPSALTHLQQAIALRPESAEAHYNLGVAQWYSGAKDNAIVELRESTRLDPALGPCHAFLGMALRERRRSRWRARVVFSARLRWGRRRPRSMWISRIAFLRRGEPAKALGQFEAGVQPPVVDGPVPDWDRAIKGSASRSRKSRQCGGAQHSRPVLGQKGADGAAVAAEFREAIRLRPEYAEAHNNLGLVLIQSGDDAAGIAALREALRIAPDYADARTNLGAALTPTDAAAAIRELEKAVALAPQSVKAQFNLAMAYGANPGADRPRRSSSSQGHRARRRGSLELTSRWARRFYRTARCPKPSRRCRRRPGWSRQTARRTTSSVWRSREPGERRRRQRRFRKAASSWPPTTAISRPH